MKNDRSVKKRMLLAICTAAGVLLAALGATAAIYTSQVYQRSVVRNRDNEIIRFSSDKLFRVAVGTDAPIYYYPMGEGQKTMTFQVYNFDHAKNTLFNEKAIDYKVTIQIEDGTEAFEYRISNGTETKVLESGGSVSFDNERLAGRKRSANTYSLTFADEDYNRIKVHVTVTPEDLTVTQNRILNGILIPIEYATTQGVTVRSEYPDSKRGTPDDFEAYNLSVSVSGGAAKVRITWDPSELDIDPFFAAGKSVNTTADDWSEIIVLMDSGDVTGSYLIQFYNNTGKHQWTAWNKLPIVVEQVDEAEGASSP